MKKIGIITFHKAHNYGAVLQAFALKSYLSQKGFDVTFIDYDPIFLAKNKIFNMSFNNGLVFFARLFVSDIILLKSRYRRKKGFDNFINRFLKSEIKVNSDVSFKVPKDIETVIIGSDQVWNVRLANGVNQIYFGNFEFENKLSNLISYAASFSDFKISNDEKNEIKQYLKNFNALSVREIEGQLFLDKELGYSSTLVMDPVFLLNADEWIDSLKLNEIKEPYVLVYSIGHEIETNKLADKVCEQLNLNKICLTAYLDRHVFNNTYQTATPSEFVQLFAHAKFVITSSFHGTAFSLIFKKSFYSIGHNNDKDSRQLTLLKMFELESRLVPYNTDFDSFQISQNDVSCDLDQVIALSKDFLKTSIVYD
jgi:hypothetical protein